MAPKISFMDNEQLRKQIMGKHESPNYQLSTPGYQPPSTGIDPSSVRSEATQDMMNVVNSAAQNPVNPIFNGYDTQFLQQNLGLDSMEFERFMRNPQANQGTIDYLISQGWLQPMQQQQQVQTSGGGGDYIPQPPAAQQQQDWSNPVTFGTDEWYGSMNPPAQQPTSPVMQGMGDIKANNYQVNRNPHYTSTQTQIRDTSNDAYWPNALGAFLAQYLKR